MSGGTHPGVVGQHPRADALRQVGQPQINTALHRIAMTQLRDGAGQVYYRKRIEMGDPPMAALRRLKRRLARVVYNRMKADTAAANV
jgi:transposase